MMSYKRGDVILIRFPHSNLTSYSKRPALIIQDENINTGLNQRIVALITSNLHRSGETRVFVSTNSKQGQEMGLITDSVIVADNIAPVLSKAIEKPIGRCCLSMPAVETALRKVLKL
jgi:mRNA interferase MazF